MKLSSQLPVLLLGLLLRQDQVSAHNHADCSTKDPSRREVLREEALMSLQQQRQTGRIRGRQLQTNTTTTTTLCRKCIDIPVVVHIIEDFVGFSEATFYVTDLNIRTQLDVLNQHFQETPFSFTLQDTLREANNEWAYGNLYEVDQDINGVGYTTDLVETISAALRVGGADVANIFFTDGVCNAANFASLPYYRGLFPDGVYSKADFIFLCPLAIARGDEAMNETTLSHEVGHWLGLYHTFTGNDCNGPGDFIDDTPQQANSSTFEAQDCLVERNSCPELPGTDPIHNFMSYGACRTEFTPNQVERMYDQFNRFRRRVKPCQSWQALIELDIQFESENPEETILYYVEWGLKYGITIHMSPVGEEHIAFRSQRVVQDFCWPISTLHEFRMDDAGLDGMKDGQVKLSLNGYQVLDESQTDQVGTASVFLAGDSAECGAGRMRFLLEIFFEGKAEHFSWTLVTGDRVWLLTSSELTLAYGEDHYGTHMNGRKLFVDKCIDEGDYIFSVDSMDDVSTGSYSLSLESQEFLSSDLSAQSIYFDVAANGQVSDLSILTAAPSISQTVSTLAPSPAANSSQELVPVQGFIPTLAPASNVKKSDTVETQMSSSAIVETMAPSAESIPTSGAVTRVGYAAMYLLALVQYF